MQVLFLGKRHDPYVKRAVEFLRAAYGEVEDHLGDWGTPFPECSYWYDIVVSYQSRWIIPEWMLRRAKCAINFHPGPPEYRGVGCVNFALYEGAPTYGATAHFMTTAVDCGPIIASSRFRVLAADTVASVLERTYEAQLALFYDVMSRVLDGTVKASGEEWRGPVRTRKELDALATIGASMGEDEVRRRARATTFGDWKPHIEIGGATFAIDSRTPRSS